MPVSFTTLAGWHDVFPEILSHLEPIVDEEEDECILMYRIAVYHFRTTLLSLALSSRALSNPSLNKLWHYLHGFSPLLKLLPNYQCYSGVYHHMGKISPEAWLRLQTYATRVRRITLPREASVDPLVWTLILEASKGAPLFPNLVKITIRNIDATVPQALIHTLVTAPSICSVFLSFWHGRQYGVSTPMTTVTTGSILQELSVKSLGLTHLFVYAIALGREHLVGLSQFTLLKVLGVGNGSVFDDDLLPVLSNLKSLERLDISILLRDSTEPPPLDLTDGFQKLTTLALRGPPSHLARVILASSMPRLDSLRLMIACHPVDGFDASIASICRHLGPHNLTSFRADLTEEFSRPQPFLMNLLEPLLPFANLEHLQFFFVDHTPLRDEDLKCFARAWPKLRTLVLMQSSITMSDPDRVPGSVDRPRLGGLVELARGCPRLGRLSIPDLDATGPLPQLVDNIPLAGYALPYLCIQNLVGAPDKERQLAVAIVLDRLFPRLKLRSTTGIHEMRGFAANYNLYLRDSRNISKLLLDMQLARKQ